MGKWPDRTDDIKYVGKEFAGNFKRLRKKRGLSVPAFNDRLNAQYDGKGFLWSVLDWEDGLCPMVSLLPGIAAVLGVHPTDLVDEYYPWGTPLYMRLLPRRREAVMATRKKYNELKA